MSDRARKLLEEVLALPREELAEFMDELAIALDKPDPEVEAAWAAEIERRVRDVQEGNVVCEPWEKVRERLWAKLDDADRR